MGRKNRDGQLFEPSSKWIWHPDLKGTERDVRVWFQYDLEIGSWPSLQDQAAARPHTQEDSIASGEATETVLLITADSRYTLYVNGIELGSGPPRHWPSRRPVETYDISAVVNLGRNTIAVLVHSIGTSTSSYIPGRGGLLVEVHGLPHEQYAKGIAGTDESWTCRIAHEYESGPPRINVSQPFVERYDQRRVDEGKWTHASVVGPADPLTVLGPMGAPHRDIAGIPVKPQFDLMNAYPWRTFIRDQWRIHQAASVSRGTYRPNILSIDFREALFPGDITTEDRLQVGAIAIAIESERSQQAHIVRKNRRWPYEPERIWMNGVPHVIGKTESECVVSLSAGTNLLLCDVSGAYQRFWLDLVIQPESSHTVIGSLKPAAPGGIVAIGPFDSAAIGNIVCNDGFSVDMEHSDYLAVQACSNPFELASHARWLRSIGIESITTDNAKLEFEFRNRVPNSHLSWEGSALVVRPYDEITVDFGDEVSGFLELDLEIPRGFRVDGVCYEYHRSEGAELPDDLNNWFRYTSDGQRRCFRSTLRRGFRYLALTFLPEGSTTTPGHSVRHDDHSHKTDSPPLRLHAIRCHERVFPTTETAQFECSDRRLTEIFAMSRRTVALCMEDTYVDCPGFEQALWIGDTRNTALLSYVLFGAYGIARRSLLVAAQSLQRSELPESHGPSGVPLVLTAWALLWMIAVREYVIHSGDATIIPEIAPSLIETTAGIHRHVNHDGLLEISAWNMLDWAEMDTPYHGVVTHQNMLAVWALRDTALLLEEHPGHAPQETVSQIRSDADTISTAINSELWDSSREAYRDSIHADGSPSPVFSVQTNVIALLSGIVPQAFREGLFTTITSPPGDMVEIGSPFMSFFLYRLLSDHSDFDSGKVISDIRDRWGEMIDAGSTTCWETFRGFYTERLTRSYCHAWSAAPAWYLPEILLGIKQTGHAWQHVTVAPRVTHIRTDIKWARGSIMTPHGPVKVSWRRSDDGSLDVSTSAPNDVQVTVK